MDCHEITQIFEIEVSKNVHDMDGMIMIGDVIPCEIKWIDIDEFKDGKKVLYPSELVELV
jgi:hypothetical protein